MAPVMTMFCAAGIAFYVRFLIALCKESAPRRIGYWVRLRLDSDENSIAEQRQQKKPATRAA